MVDTATNTDQCEPNVFETTLHTNNDSRIRSSRSVFRCCYQYMCACFWKTRNGENVWINLLKYVQLKRTRKYSGWKWKMEWKCESARVMQNLNDISLNNQNVIMFMK